MAVIDTLENASLVLKSVTLTWRYDESSDYDVLGDFPLTKRPSKGDFATTVDVRGNIEKEITDGGTTRENALANTARELDRIFRWHNNSWEFVGCTMKGIYGLSDTDRAKLPDFVQAVVSDLDMAEGVWGINSDCGKEYKTDTESDIFTQLIASLEAEGVNCEGFTIDKVVETGDSFSITNAPEIRASDAIPDDNGKWYFIDNSDDTTLFMECRHCTYQHDISGPNDGNLNLPRCPDCEIDGEGNYPDEE